MSALWHPITRHVLIRFLQNWRVVKVTKRVLTKNGPPMSQFAVRRGWWFFGYKYFDFENHSSWWGADESWFRDCCTTEAKALQFYIYGRNGDAIADFQGTTIETVTNPQARLIALRLQGKDREHD